MRGALDMILVRKPRAGSGRSIYRSRSTSATARPSRSTRTSRSHPHPTYVDVARRFEELAVGRHGERAGDLLLLAHNGDRERPEDRYYFAKPFRSWHGSPSRQDSEVPLIVAHPKRTAEAIHTWIGALLGDRPYQRKITDIVMELRTHPPN